MDKAQLITITKGAGLAAAGAVLAYLSEVAIPLVQDGGTGIVLTIAAMASVGLNALRKMLFPSE